MNRQRKHFIDRATVMLFFATFYIVSLCAPTSLAIKLFTQEASTLQSRNEMVDRYDPRRDPEKDLAMVSAEARRSRRNILVEVGGEWCSWCHLMDAFFRLHPDIVTLRDRNYVSMKVSMSQENPNQRFLSRFPHIHGYPHIFILDADTNLIKSQPTNELEEGRGYNADRFRKLLDQFAPKGTP
jgi:thiol:disulfide interchange protein